jgi:ParB-like chromosome segregation protein Spo0J
MEQLENIKNQFTFLEKLEIDEKVKFINEIKRHLHELSPFKNEPVDFVEWVKNEEVIANEYNPNKVAPPEMQLLEISIDNDGYTQPIVTFPNERGVEVVDGFHRSRVGKESEKIKQKIHGYLPVVSIRKEQQDKNNRIASTIRHNRARGKHQIDAMSEIILELKNRNWKNSRIAKELGMDEDEILRLCQITGLESLFSDKDFNKSWVAGDSVDDMEILTDEVDEDTIENTRASNTDDPNRIFHTYDKWECFKAGFFANKAEGYSHEEAEQKFADFFKGNEFETYANMVIKDWKYSCEQNLTNSSMNRIAWLGQASVCYAHGIPSRYSSGWNLLTNQEQEIANEVALKVINKWLVLNNRDELTMDEALSAGRQVEIY